MTAPSSTNEEGWMNVSLMVSAFVIGKIAAYGIRHTLHLGVGQFAVHRKRQHRRRQRCGMAHRGVAYAGVAVCGLFVQGSGIIDHGGYALLGECGPESVAAGRRHLDGVLVVDVGGVRRLGRGHDRRQTAQTLRIARCHAPAGDPAPSAAACTVWSREFIPTSRLSYLVNQP